MILLLQFFDMHFQFVDPLHISHISVSQTIPPSPQVLKDPSCCPVLEGSAFEGSWYIVNSIANRSHHCKVNVSTLISNIFILL